MVHTEVAKAVEYCIIKWLSPKLIMIIWTLFSAIFLVCLSGCAKQNENNTSTNIGNAPAPLVASDLEKNGFFVSTHSVSVDDSETGNWAAHIFDLANALVRKEVWLQIHDADSIQLQIFIVPYTDGHETVVISRRKLDPNEQMFIWSEAQESLNTAYRKYEQRKLERQNQINRENLNKTESTEGDDSKSSHITARP